MFIDIEQHDIAATNAHPDFGRSPEIDYGFNTRKEMIESAEPAATKVAGEGPKDPIGPGIDLGWPAIQKERNITM